MAKFIFIFWQFLTQGKVTFAKSRLAPADFLTIIHGIPVTDFIFLELITMTVTVTDPDFNFCVLD